MATDDDKESAAAAGDSDHPKRGGRRGGRGERSSGDLTQREIETALARIPPDRLQAILAASNAHGVQASTTPKLSKALDTVAAEDADAMIDAIDESLEIVETAKSGQGEARDKARSSDPLGPIRDVSPEVAAAIATNSSYRQKSIEHSMRTAKRYLEAHHGPEAVADRD